MFTLASVLAWVAWHGLGHGGFVIGGPTPESESHSHANVLVTVHCRYVTTPTEGVLKTAELLAAWLTAVLLRRDSDAA